MLDWKQKWGGKYAMGNAAHQKWIQSVPVYYTGLL